MNVKNILRVRWQYKGQESTCIIEPHTNKGDAPLPAVAKATIRRYVKDPENRALARFKTLTKAVQQLPKADRYDVWETFRTSKKKNLWSRPCKPKVKH